MITAAPQGSGVGQADQFGTQLAGANEAAGVGENMYLTTYTSVGPLGLVAFAVWLVAVLLSLLRGIRPTLPVWVSVGVGAGLLAEAAAGMTASTLMRFTTAASIWLMVGLVIAVPVSRSRWSDLSVIRHPRQWLRSRSTKPAAQVSEG